jgi:hypothetical protein
MLDRSPHPEVGTMQPSAPSRVVPGRHVVVAPAPLGTAGLSLGAATVRGHAGSPQRSPVQQVVDVAATIEVLMTVVTTTALQKLSLPAAAVETVGAAAREELLHYEVLTQDFGGRPSTHRVWIPDAVFASPTALFSALVVGEQICIDLYLVATTVWARAGRSGLARVGAELVGNEAVHRALARQALGLQPSDRAFMNYDQVDQADGPGHGRIGFTEPQGAVESFEAAGFGFGAPGAAPGALYDFETVRRHTPNPSFVNTRTPR